uniref:Uncharacterized protein n=1 Tax=Cannabis sativa TaxID=3483 RepID=A0A803QNL1_CANSA
MKISTKILPLDFLTPYTPQPEVKKNDHSAKKEVEEAKAAVAKAESYAEELEEKNVLLEKEKADFEEVVEEDLEIILSDGVSPEESSLLSSVTAPANEVLA